MGLKYIYAGYSKCGTKTMAKAFRELGYKVYDFEETFGYCTDALEKFYSPQFTKTEKIEILRDLLTDVDIVLGKRQ